MSQEVRNRKKVNLRDRAMLNKMLEKTESRRSIHSHLSVSRGNNRRVGSTHSIDSESENNPKKYNYDVDESMLGIHEHYANTVLNKLYVNDERFDRLEMDIELLQGSKWSNLLRALSANNVLKHVVIKEGFLPETLREEKIRMLLEIVGRLPQLETLGVYFPNRIAGSAASLLCSAVQHGVMVEKITVGGLRLVEEGEEDELAEAFQALTQLKTLRLLDLVIYKDIDIDPFLETVAELPELHDLEIRMKYKKADNFKGMFFESLCESKTLTSLILWNMVLDMIQVTHVCEAITKSTNIKRFELWRCDLGPTFGILLSDVISKNKSLETVIISHVGFYGSGVVGLTNALKRNNHTSNITELRLLNVCSDQEKEARNVTKAAISMMAENSKIDTITFSYDELTESNCVALDKHFRESSILRKRREQILANRSKWRTRFEILFGITSKY